MAKKWERLLKEVDGLIASSNGGLFDRATRLVQVWEDGEFLAFHNGNIDAAEESLNSKLGDYGLTIFDVKSMLGEFPKKEQWETGKLRMMLATAMEAEESRRQEHRAPATTKRQGPIARKEFEQLQKQYEATQSQVATIQSRAESMAEENARLREENHKLRFSLERANGRIEELERALSRELQPA